MVGHDRGARVGYRMALDHPGSVDRLVVLNVIPTIDQFARMSGDTAPGYWPWVLLAQPAPMPERLLGAAVGGHGDGRGRAGRPLRPRGGTRALLALLVPFLGGGPRQQTLGGRDVPRAQHPNTSGRCTGSTARVTASTPER